MTNESHVSHTARGNPNNIAFKCPDLLEGWAASDRVELAIVDTGACDAIIPPHVFKHTEPIKKSEHGSTYKACGAEVVTNMGFRKVHCIYV